MNISYFLCGYALVSVDLCDAAEFMNLCMLKNIPYADFKVCGDRLCVKLRLAALKKLLAEAEKSDLKILVEKRGGVPIFFSKYKNRYGVFFGVLASLALIFLSQNIVWNVDVIGNENITACEVSAKLRDYGFGVGSYIPAVNTDKIENKMLIDYDAISWISINIKGTVATVEIREYREPYEEVSVRPANLVAAKSGLVEEVRIYKGNVLVSKGKYVEKGDLLVSGLYDSERVGFRFTRASGSVFAKTTTEYYVEIPYEYTKKEYTGEEYYEKYLNFFDFLIKISKNSRNDIVFYDKIDTVDSYCLPDGVQTPISVRTVRYIEYEEVNAYRTEEEAETLAYFELSRQLAEIADEAIIIRKQITPIVRDDSFALICRIVAIEDIALVSEFDVDMDIVE